MTSRRGGRGLQDRHGDLFRELLPNARPLPGAIDLLADLRERGVTHGIATSGRRPDIDAVADGAGRAARDGRRGARRGRRARSPRRTSSSSARAASAPTRRTATWSATPSGTCWRPAALGCSPLACSRAATAPTSCRARARSASTATRASSRVARRARDRVNRGLLVIGADLAADVTGTAASSRWACAPRARTPWRSPRSRSAAVTPCTRSPRARRRTPRPPTRAATSIPARSSRACARRPARGPRWSARPAGCSPR